MWYYNCLCMESRGLSVIVKSKPAQISSIDHCVLTRYYRERTLHIRPDYRSSSCIRVACWIIISLLGCHCCHVITAVHAVAKLKYPSGKFAISWQLHKIRSISHNYFSTDHWINPQNHALVRCGCGVGCTMGNQFTNVLAYADDLVLLPPSWKALQLLLNILAVEAVAINMTCNTSKTVCMVFPPHQIVIV